MKINKQELSEILTKHKKWRRNEEVGARADLRRADLHDAYLSCADLRGTIGNGAEIKTILASDAYHILYTAEILQIGCERHSIEKWWAFNEKEIRKMDGNKATEFWARWKDVIKTIIELSPATPTGHEKKAEAAA